jgi:hypothetical protein
MSYGFRNRRASADLELVDMIKRGEGQGAILTGADLEGADLRRVNLYGAKLQGADLFQAILMGADLERANLQRANLQRANLQRANLEGANLQYANLEGAKLQDADLTGAKLQGAVLTGANLTGVEYDASTIWPDDFTPPGGGGRMASRRTANRKDWVMQLPAWSYIENSSYAWSELPTPDDVAISAWTKSPSEGLRYHTMFVLTPRTKKVKTELYSDVNQMMRALDFYIKEIREREEFVRSRNEARKSQIKSLTPNVGDILYESWGYDQTNVNFYEVLEVLGVMVVIREVPSRQVSDDGDGTVKVVAVPGRYIGQPMRKKIKPAGVDSRSYSVKIRSFSNAHLWDGKPRYETAFGWGH